MAAQTEKLTLEVATPIGLALRTQAESVQAPSVAGEFGVLPGHLPLLAAVHAGVLRYRIEGKDYEAAIGPGFIEAGPDKVRLLTEFFAKPDEIDIEATKAELVAAEERLKAFKDEHEGQVYEEAERDVDWARAKLDITKDRV